MGTSNYFKSKLALKPNQVKERLKRMHRVLKSAWYLKTHEECIMT